MRQTEEIAYGSEVLMVDEHGFGLMEKLVNAYCNVPIDLKLTSENWPRASLSPSDKLMRFTTVEYLKKIIQTRRNFLASVLKWQDVWEGLIRNIDLKDRKGDTIDMSEITSSFYGQCWSLSEFDSELLWNARSSKTEQNGLCIRTTFGKLASSFIEGIGIEALDTNIVARFDKVQYLSDEQFEDMFQTLCADTFNFDTMCLTGERLLDCLMVKRHRFADEKEVRLIVDYAGVRGRTPDYLAPRKFVPDLKGLTYTIDPSCFLDEIIVDPRIPKENAAKIVKELDSDLKRFGWSGCVVRQSDLYDCKRISIPTGI